MIGLTGAAHSDRELTVNVGAPCFMRCLGYLRRIKPYGRKQAVCGREAAGVTSDAVGLTVKIHRFNAGITHVPDKVEQKRQGAGEFLIRIDTSRGTLSCRAFRHFYEYDVFGQKNRIERRRRGRRDFLPMHGRSCTCHGSFCPV